ncbi:MAG: hypothetical protein MZU79_01885 [Anaerotruncus sp.]|nr:hypothetical protein [Anaerotruncus sp.]
MGVETVSQEHPDRVQHLGVLRRQPRSRQSAARRTGSSPPPTHPAPFGCTRATSTSRPW